MDILKLLSNAVRLQVVQYLQINEEATTKQISQALQEIPAPTLYRHINAMINEELLLVKEERKVRGSLERILIINKDKFTEAEHKDISNTAYQFLMGLYSQFKQYSNKIDVDMVKDRLAMRTTVFSLTDEQFDEFLKEIAKVYTKYQKIGNGTDGKNRSISFISAPMEEEK